MMITNVAAFSWAAAGGVEVDDDTLQSMADYSAGMADAGASLEAIEDAVLACWAGLREVGTEMVGTELHVVVVPAHRPELTIVR